MSYTATAGVSDTRILRDLGGHKLALGRKYH